MWPHHHPECFAQFYAAQAADRVDQLLKASFAQANLDLDYTDKVRQEILSDISQSGIPTYVISALARVAPIFLVALLFGIYFGRRDVLSISVGAALLAFLLVWPIILLWDTVVQSQWANYQELFLGMYLLYIIAFFAVARCGALIGSYWGEKLNRHEPSTLLKITATESLQQAERDALQQAASQPLKLFDECHALSLAELMIRDKYTSPGSEEALMPRGQLEQIARDWNGQKALDNADALIAGLRYQRLVYEVFQRLRFRRLRK